jgi:hypothetical protein
MLSSDRSSQFKEMSWILGLSYANEFGVHQAVLGMVYKSVVFYLGNWNCFYIVVTY